MGFQRLGLALGDERTSQASPLKCLVSVMHTVPGRSVAAARASMAAMSSQGKHVDTSSTTSASAQSHCSRSAHRNDTCCACAACPASSRLGRMSYAAAETWWASESRATDPAWRRGYVLRRVL